MKTDKLYLLLFNLKRVSGILSRIKTDNEGRVMMPKNDLEMLRMNAKLINEKSVNSKLN